MSTAAIASRGADMPGGSQSASLNNRENIDRLALNLNSNNPFRNRAISPSQLSPQPLVDTTSTFTSGGLADLRPTMSNNPFLDATELRSRNNNNNNSSSTAAPTNAAVNVPSDIFNDLSLVDKPAVSQKTNGAAPPPPYTVQSGRALPGSSAVQPPRGPARPTGSPRRPDIDRHRRPRGMSETSVGERDRQERRDRERERSDQPSRTESEERRRKERRKEREERRKREKEGASSRKGTRRPQGLDIIDKLDVTGIYGQGLFHHDGPFDACNPHRNARKDQRAPMQAFPANSANMQLGGSGPINHRIDLDRFHGRGEEAFGAFNTTRRGDTQIIDPTSRTEAIHGHETYGLGTSTFLEGAPATRRDIQRKDSDERREEFSNAGGLSRKKSLAQKFRGMSSGRANRPTDIRTPDGKFNGEVFDASPTPLTSQGNSHGKSVSAGGLARATSSKDAEYNPFDNYYENEYEKKGAQIRVAEQERGAGRARAPSSPMGNTRGLSRTITTDSIDTAAPANNDGETKSGFLSRMKSLKGGKRARPERRAS